MSSTGAGMLAALALVAALAVTHVPLGNYMAWVFGSERHLRVERVIYRVVRVNPDADQRWTLYALSLLAFSAACVLVLYGLQRLQGVLPWSLGLPAVTPALAWNTAASFVSNTNWQNYPGESTMGHLVQMAGLAVQNFVSAAVGLAVAIALVRGFARARIDRVGNVWVDVVRGCLRILLPLSVLAAIVLMASGRSDPEPVRPTRRTHADRLHAGDPGRPGGDPGSDQRARHERRRLLQRQLDAPVREPDALHQLARGPAAPAHPVRAAAHVRPARGGPAAGLGDRRRDSGDLHRVAERDDRVRAAPLRSGAAGGRRGDGGQGGPVRRAAGGAVRHRDDHHVDGRGRLDARLLHAAGRRHRADQHDARGDHTGRGRLRALRDPRRRGRDRVRGRADGRPDPGVPGQEDPVAGGEVRRPVHPRHPGGGARRHGRRDGHPLRPAPRC